MKTKIHGVRICEMQHKDMRENKVGESECVCVCVCERKRELYIVRHLQLRFGLSRNFSSYISSRLRAVNGHYHHFQSGPLEKIIF